MKENCKHNVSKKYLKVLGITKEYTTRYGVLCNECQTWIYDKKEKKYKIPKDLKNIPQVKLHFKGEQSFELLNYTIAEYHRKFFSPKQGERS